MIFSNILIKNGVDDEQIDACMQWAFGDAWGTMPCNDADNEWRTRHPDKPIIYGCDSPEIGFKIIAEEYLKWRKEND